MLRTEEYIDSTIVIFMTRLNDVNHALKDMFMVQSLRSLSRNSPRRDEIFSCNRLICALLSCFLLNFCYNFYRILPPIEMLKEIRRTVSRDDSDDIRVNMVRIHVQMTYS